MDHPVDTPLSATSRFLVEISAWILVPWALWQTSVMAAVAALVVLIALPATFNAPGDKRVDGVAVPGPVRIGIEAVLFLAAVWGALRVVPGPLDTVAVAALVAALLTQVRRWRWLATRSTR